MAVLTKRAKAPASKAPASHELGGRELALLLRKMDSAKTAAEKKRWRREFLRGFYGDRRADSYA